MKKLFFRSFGFVLGLVIVFFIVGNQVWAGSSAQLPFLSSQITSCGETGSWNILIIGSDYADLRGQKGSDLTRVLHIDFENNKVSIYSFTRNLWVDTIGLGLTNPSFDGLPLGMVFYQGRIQSTQFSETNTIVDGTRVTARMLSKNFSISTDHYLAIDLKYLGEIIDDLGGLPINIPTRTTDPYIGMVIPAGQQTLSGAQVVAYARAIPDDDFGRIQRNNLIVEALRQKLIDPSMITKTSDLFTKFKSIIATDLSLDQVNNLGCVFKNLRSDSIIIDGIQKEWTSPGPQGSLNWNKDRVLARLTELGIIH